MRKTGAISSRPSKQEKREAREGGRGRERAREEKGKENFLMRDIDQEGRRVQEGRSRRGAMQSNFFS
jgi:hypothetical protein